MGKGNALGDLTMTPRLSTADTALVVVDMQERLLPAIHEHERVIANVRLLLRAATALELPVVPTTQYLRGPTFKDTVTAFQIRSRADAPAFPVIWGST